MDTSRALAILNDPSASGADLMELASEFPQYWARIAVHPSAYPDLLTWLEQEGSDVVRAAIVGRRMRESSGRGVGGQAPSLDATIRVASVAGQQPAPLGFGTPPNPTSPPNQFAGRPVAPASRGPSTILIVGAAVGFVAVVGLILWLVVFNNGTTGTDPYYLPPTTAARTTTAPPPVTTTTRTQTQTTTVTARPTTASTNSAGVVQPGVWATKINTRTVKAADGLNLRKGPSTQYDVIVAIAKNQAVDILGYHDSNYDEWLFVSYKGTQGWVNQAYLN